MSKINYQELLDNALKSVVKEALVYAQINGLGDGTHFFITFKTRDPGVVLPDFLRMRYPDLHCSRTYTLKAILSFRLLPVFHISA